MLGFPLAAYPVGGSPTAAPSIVNLVGAGSTQSSTSSTGAASVTPAGGGAKTVNLVAATSTQSATSGTGSASVTHPGAQPSAITVPASRTAVFAGRPRVIVFDGKAPATAAKGGLDELYYVGDFTKDLNDGATTAASIAPVSFGVAVLEGPVLQNGFGVVKLGPLDTTPGAQNFFTFRVTCANGEQFDCTIQFTILDDRSWVFGKDPDDQRFYAFDLGADSALGRTSIASVQAPAVVGVSALPAAAVIQGNLAIVKIGGLDTADSAPNSCGLAITFANTEKVFRTIYFKREQH